MVFLCSVCAEMIDKNNGIDFSVETLRQWKTDHEKWVRDNLNKKLENNMVIINGNILQRSWCYYGFRN